MDCKPSSRAGTTWELIERDEDGRPGKPPAHVAKDPEGMMENIVLGMQEHRDAERMREFLRLSRGQLEENCRACGVQVPGTNLCRALELTACGASPGVPTLPAGKLERTIPELFEREIQADIEDLFDGANHDLLKSVCTKRELHNSSTKI